MRKLGRKAVLAALASSILVVAGCATETTYRPATGTGFTRTGYQRAPGRARPLPRQLRGQQRDVARHGRALSALSRRGADAAERLRLFPDGQPRYRPAVADLFDARSRRLGLRRVRLAIGVRRGAITAAASAGAAGTRGSAARLRAVRQRLRCPHDRPVRSDGRDRDRQGADPRDNVRAFDARAVVDSIGPSVVLPEQVRR